MDLARGSPGIHRWIGAVDGTGAERSEGGRRGLWKVGDRRFEDGFGVWEGWDLRET